MFSPKRIAVVADRTANASGDQPGKVNVHISNKWMHSDKSFRHYSELTTSVTLKLARTMLLLVKQIPFG